MKAVYVRQLLLLIILVLAFLLVVSAFIVTSAGFAAAFMEAGVDSKKKDIIQYREDNVIIFESEEIRADILALEQETEGLLSEIIGGGSNHGNKS